MFFLAALLPLAPPVAFGELHAVPPHASYFNPRNELRSAMLKPVLTANWRYLVFYNFAVEPELLVKRVPAGLEIDFDKKTTFLSVVGFLCADAVLLDQPVLRQRLFERVQLRFYVRRPNLDDWRRGTVTICELVPRAVAPALVHVFRGEPLQTRTMRHELVDRDDQVGVEYGWRQARGWEGLLIAAQGQAQAVSVGSHADFIIERGWQYTALSARVLEYRIEHPRWRIWPAVSWRLDPGVFGPEFAEVLQTDPHSVFLAQGSHVHVQARVL